MTQPPNTAEKRALVTGASRGIGAAIAERLAADGYGVIVNYRSDASGAESTVRRIEEAGGEAVAAQFDVSSSEDTRAAIAGLLEDERPVGVLVNNAGITRDAAFPMMTDDDWGAVLRTSLDGFFHTTQALTMHMVGNRWGRIVNMSSISATRANRGQANYAAAKAGLLGATRALAMELAKRRITVNAVAPGLVDTEMIAGVPKEIVSSIPMRRVGRPSEVAALVSFLASEEAGYITAQTIGIDGGF